MLSFPEQRMFTASYGRFGQIKPYVVTLKAMINIETFIKWILKPMLLEDILRLYGANKNKAVLHFDSARSHAGKLTHDWLIRHKLNHVTKDEWLANSSESSPMDYFASTYIRSHLKMCECVI